MSATTLTTARPTAATVARSRRGRIAPLITLIRRRLVLTLRTPRAILLPLATPVLIAVVIAPALAKTAGPVGAVDYLTYLAIGTAALVIPLSCMQAGLGVIVDRRSGAQPDLLAAPVPRALLVLANLAAALLASGLQLATLVAFAALRGAELPLAVVAKLLPVTHALALMRYGVVDPRAGDLHAIWGLANPTLTAALSLTVLILYALATTYIAIRVFTRKAQR